MAGGSKQTVTQIDPYKLPYQKDIYKQAQTAYGQTSKNPTDFYAAPNAVQTGAVQQGLEAAKNLNPSAVTAPASESFANLFGSNGELAKQASSMKFTPTTANVAGYSPLAALPQYSNQYMADSLNAFTQGINPNPGGQNELMGAINAGLAPLQQYLEETVIPNAKLHMSERGTGADAYGIDIAQQIRDQYARPGTELAGRLAYEDYVRRAQNEAQRYGMQYQTGAQLTGDEYARQAAGAMQGREITSTQTTAKNELAQRAAEAKNASLLQAQKQKADFISQMALATITGAQAAPSIAAGSADAALLPSTIAGALGGQLQDWEQAGLTAGQAAPWQGLNEYASLVYGGTPNTVQTAKKTPGVGDIIQGGLGGGLLGLGLSNAGLLGLGGGTAGGLGAGLGLLAMI